MISSFKKLMQLCLSVPGKSVHLEPAKEMRLTLQNSHLGRGSHCFCPRHTEPTGFSKLPRAMWLFLFSFSFGCWPKPEYAFLTPQASQKLSESPFLLPGCMLTPIPTHGLTQVVWCLPLHHHPFPSSSPKYKYISCPAVLLSISCLISLIKLSLTFLPGLF